MPSGAAFVTLAEHLEQQLGPGFAKRHEAELIDDQQLVFANCFWNRNRRFSSLASMSSWTKAAAVNHQSRQTEAEGDMGFAGAAIAKCDDVFTTLAWL